MDPGIFYAVLAALGWGVYIFVLKRFFSAYSGAQIAVAVNAFALLWYAPVTATRLDPDSVPSLATLGVSGIAVVAATIVFIGLGFVLFIYALDGGDVSYVAPINKLVPVFVLPIEILLLSEHLTALQLGGVAVATMAVYVANYEGGGLFDPLRRAATSRPAQFALASAACYAASDVGKRVGLQELAIPTTLWVPILFVGGALVLFPLAVRDWRPIRQELPRFAAAGLLVAGSEHVTSVAFSLVPASIGSPIINTQAVVAVILGGVILRESQFGTRLVAAFLAVAGVALIAIGDVGMLVAAVR
ncbi:EamA family transporter [Haloferax sp. MBLA0076]|uniref:EamA family transporter n=1 Tax=Haloferax litoreum TaxID=2666140 RepID=A0A6A8GDX3_9EURY|nr:MULTISPECIES: DMT family transporter [Haloferax]KAB1193072.1 EamA family transporter [Haloferax sp. CBA1148]MRX21564.1 EamA family transporter [Haloferax litoreum]